MGFNDSSCFEKALVTPAIKNSINHLNELCSSKGNFWSFLAYLPILVINCTTVASVFVVIRVPVKGLPRCGSRVYWTPAVCLSCRQPLSSRNGEVSVVRNVPAQGCDTCLVLRAPKAVKAHLMDCFSDWGWKQEVITTWAFWSHVLI